MDDSMATLLPVPTVITPVFDSVTFVALRVVASRVHPPTVPEVAVSTPAVVTRNGADVGVRWPAQNAVVVVETPTAVAFVNPAVRAVVASVKPPMIPSTARTV